MKLGILLIVLSLIICSMVPLWASEETPPSFTLAWSEYPSWSTFGVADELKIINGKRGKLGPIEKKWNVDIVLKEADYDPCLVMYGSGQCDAVCITNMDVLSPSLTVSSVAILPTSTSDGADACIVTDGITDIKQLKGKKVYGLAKTVSEYCFVRNLELLGEKERDYKFTNMDPAAAALAMQQSQRGYNAIMVWNPFVLETLKRRKDARVLFDSSSIPGEIVDMVVMSQKAYNKEGGRRFASAIIDTFYAINERIKNPDTRDDTLIALGEKFSHLKLNSMKKVVKQTKFYKTPKAGIALYSDPTFQKIMKKVVNFCVDHEIVGRAPAIDYNNDQGKFDLIFTTEPMERVLELKEEQMKDSKESKNDNKKEEPEVIKKK